MEIHIIEKQNKIKQKTSNLIVCEKFLIVDDQLMQLEDCSFLCDTKDSATTTSSA